MNLSPEEGGMLSPEQHPSTEVSLDDFGRGLNELVAVVRRDPLWATDEVRAEGHVEALTIAGFSVEELRGLLACALVRLAQC